MIFSEAIGLSPGDRMPPASHEIDKSQRRA
jgi:hypothetical protein